jgi:hypothetical protein
MKDPLTYTYPRTWAEVISRHQCTGYEAVAIERHKRPLTERVVNVVFAVSIGLLLVGFGAAYFDVLVK